MPAPQKPLLEKNIEKFISNTFDKKEKVRIESVKFEWFVNSMHIWHYSSQTFNLNIKI
jgi:hypothetical protein